MKKKNHLFIGQCRSKTRLHGLCSLLLIYIVRERSVSRARHRNGKNLLLDSTLLKLVRILKRLHSSSGLTDWMVFYTAFNNISVISRRQLTLFMPFLGFTSTRLGLWNVSSKDTPTKSPEDPVRLEPRTPGLRVKHVTAEPLRTPQQVE